MRIETLLLAIMSLTIVAILTKFNVIVMTIITAIFIIAPILYDIHISRKYEVKE